MAAIGMKYPVYAPITTETAGSAIVYGTGAVLAHAIAATITQNHRDNPLYADDIKVENDNGMSDYTISMEVDDVPMAARTALLGEVAENGTGSTVSHYAVTGDAAPYVGFGYLRVRMVGGTTKYDGYWFHKVQFALDGENATTKKEQIEWQTDKLTGTGFGVTIDSTGKIKMYDHMEFTTEAAAKTWLNTRAGITG